MKLSLKLKYRFLIERNVQIFDVVKLTPNLKKIFKHVSVIQIRILQVFYLN